MQDLSVCHSRVTFSAREEHLTGCHIPVTVPSRKSLDTPFRGATNRYGFAFKLSQISATPPPLKIAGLITQQSTASSPIDVTQENLP